MIVIILLQNNTQIICSKTHGAKTKYAKHIFCIDWPLKMGVYRSNTSFWEQNKIISMSKSHFDLGRYPCQIKN